MLHAHVGQDHDEHLDGCLCGIDLSLRDSMPDDELPPSAGGLALDAAAALLDDDAEPEPGILSEDEATSDSDLPFTVGGVA